MLAEIFTQAPTPDWYRWVMIVLGAVGALASALFVGGFLFSPAASYRRRDIRVLDQWCLYGAAGLASLLYLARYVYSPPVNWGGPGFALMSMSILALVDTAFLIRLWTWRSARRAHRAEALHWVND